MAAPSGPPPKQTFPTKGAQGRHTPARKRLGKAPLAGAPGLHQETGEGDAGLFAGMESAGPSTRAGTEVLQDDGGGAALGHRSQSLNSHGAASVPGCLRKWGSFTQMPNPTAKSWLLAAA